MENLTDKKLLELAAKACGLSEPSYAGRWNPLSDDGDALRLATDLNFDICIRELEVIVRRKDIPSLVMYEPLGRNHYGAVRRCIVRAAASLDR